MSLFYHLLLTWLKHCSGDEKARAFQLLDTFHGYYQKTGGIPTSSVFAIPHDLGQAAHHVEHYFLFVAPGTLETELHSLQWLRPEGCPPLPTFAVRTEAVLQELPSIRTLLAPAPPVLGADVALEDMLKIRSHTFKGLVRDLGHFSALKTEYERLNNKKDNTDVPDCDDFPQDLDDQRSLVRELFEAMVDFSEIVEEPRLVRKNKKRQHSELENEDSSLAEYRDNTHVKRVKESSDVEIELLAWNLLFAIKEAQDGRVGLGPWASNWKYDKFATFRERFDVVKDVCLCSKSVVASMMNADLTRRLAAGPRKEINQKMQNKKVNALRDQQVKSGLYAIDIGLVNMNEDRSLTDREGRYIAPAPPATKRVERDVKFGTPRAKRHKHDADQDEVTELVETSEPHQPVDFNEESAPPWWEWCRRAQEREAMTSQAHMSSSDTSGNASVFVEGLGILPFGPSSPHQLGGNDTLVTCRSSDQGLAPEHNEQPGDDGRLGRRAV